MWGFSIIPGMVILEPTGFLMLQNHEGKSGGAWKKDSTIAPINQNYYFNEPLYGYYNSADPGLLESILNCLWQQTLTFLP